MSHAAPIEIVLRYESAESDVMFVGVIDDGEVRLSSVGASDEIVGPVTAFPLLVAPRVGLGPRPRPSERTPTLEFELEGSGRAAVDVAVPAHRRSRSALAGEWALWSLVVVWEGPDGTVTDGLVVVDGGDEGIATLNADDDAVVLRPTTSSAVWALICGALPYASEFASSGGAP